MPCKEKGLHQFSALTLDDTLSSSALRLSMSSSDNVSHEKSAGTIGRGFTCPGSDDVKMTFTQPVELLTHIHPPLQVSPLLSTGLPVTPISFTPPTAPSSFNSTSVTSVNP